MAIFVLMTTMTTQLPPVHACGININMVCALCMYSSEGYWSAFPSLLGTCNNNSVVQRNASTLAQEVFHHNIHCVTETAVMV